MEAVVKVIAKDDHSLLLTFNTGEVRMFDMRPYLTKGLFVSLVDLRVFRQAYVAYDTVCWPGKLDIAPETLYDRSVPVEAALPQAAESRPQYKTTREDPQR